MSENDYGDLEDCLHDIVMKLSAFDIGYYDEKNSHGQCVRCNAFVHQLEANYVQKGSCRIHTPRNSVFGRIARDVYVRKGDDIDGV